MKRAFVPRRSISLGTAAVVVLLAIPLGQAQIPEVPDWIGLPLTLSMDVVSLTDPMSTQEELPGLGHKFQLLGVMMDDKDPDNRTNDTISATTTPGAVALAFRNLPPGIKITALDDQINLKYRFVAPRSCFAGSPRITLLVDSDGDGDTDFAIHGHVNPPTHAGCPPGPDAPTTVSLWRVEDLTDDGPRWEVTPGTALPISVFPFTPWETVEMLITTLFPNHKILAGFLVDDSCFVAGLPSCGKAYYDLVTIENRTLENDQDTVKDGQ